MDSRINLKKKVKNLKSMLFILNKLSFLYLSFKLKIRVYNNIIFFKKIFIFLQFFGFYKKNLIKNFSVLNTNNSLRIFQSLNDYFFSQNFFNKINKGSRWLSMEEIITHFIFYSEGPSLPTGFSQGGVEAPKGHLGVAVVSRGTNKPERARIRSSILVMAGQITSLVQGVSLGDFVVIVSGSNIVVGEIDR